MQLIHRKKILISIKQAILIVKCKLTPYNTWKFTWEKFLCWENGAQFQCDVGLILSSHKGSAFESNDAKCAARGLHVLGRIFNQLSYIFSGFNLVLLSPFLGYIPNSFGGRWLVLTFF